MLEKEVQFMIGRIGLALLIACSCPLLSWADDMSDASFNSEVDDFNSSLDSQGDRMRQSYDASEQSRANTALTRAQAERMTTLHTWEQSFQNTQQEMVQSGGGYNSNGSGFMGGWGGGYGGWGTGGGGGMDGGMGGGSSFQPTMVSPDYPSVNYPHWHTRASGRGRSVDVGD